jgi:acetoacetyl-CoA synthetase
MTEAATPDVLWRPGERELRDSRVAAFMRFAERRGHGPFAGYDDLWRWSTDDLEGFWAAIWDFFQVRAATPYERVLTDHRMPGARWFPGATLNYAEHALTRTGPEIAIHGRSQTRAPVDLSFDELRRQVAAARKGLQRLGVGRGDRVVAYLPNVPEAVVAFLACASLGAVWSSCSPEFGVRSVVDRFGQIEPVLLLAVDGYRYGTRELDRRQEVRTLADALPTLRHVVTLPYLHPDDPPPEGTTTWADLLAEPGELAFDPLPFDHPLCILYSSGTTGLPKAIVHGHGGITLEHLKALALIHDVGPGDRFFWFTTTAWMMWNINVAALLAGAATVCVDGDPAFPDLGALWRLAAELGMTVFGSSATYFTNCRKQGLRPGAEHDLSRLRELGSTGSPLPEETFRWVYDAVSPRVHLATTSGGTDVCTSFVGGSLLLPVVAGEISGRLLGARVAAFDATGTPVVGEQGELVVTAPMPSMPVGFWNDDDGARYRAAYFETYPGVWRHGDWITITERGTCIISGRSDSTLNRAGVRLGTAEFYDVVEAVPGIADSLVVHLEDPDGGAGRLVLLVALAEGTALDDELRGRIAATLRASLSPRHVPDEVHALPGIPRTLTGKKLEVPVKRVLQGAAPEAVASPGSITHPEVLRALRELREE